jgi:hypothetical protein
MPDRKALRRKAPRPRRQKSDTRSLETPVASEYVPQLGKYAVTMESRATLLLSEEEILERARQEVLRTMKTPDPLRRARGRRPLRTAMPWRRMAGGKWHGTPHGSSVLMRKVGVSEPTAGDW